jgi:hypothetical protein
MFNQQTKPRGKIGRLVFLVAIFGWLPVSVGGQEIERLREVSLLPRTTGEALTVVPTDMPDVCLFHCRIEAQRPGAQPDRAMPAPRHLRPPPHLPQTLLAQTGGYTSLCPQRYCHSKDAHKASHEQVWVWLGVREKPSDDMRRVVNL